MTSLLGWIWPQMTLHRINVASWLHSVRHGRWGDTNQSDFNTDWPMLSAAGTAIYSWPAMSSCFHTALGTQSRHELWQSLAAQSWLFVASLRGSLACVCGKVGIHSAVHHGIIIKGKNAALCLYSWQKHKPEPLHQILTYYKISITILSPHLSFWLSQTFLHDWLTENLTPPLEICF